MTDDDFRRLALALQGAEERAHHAHPDFRVGGRIFATLGYPNGEWGMVNLTPGQQREHVRQHPQSFVPVKGAWGEQGCTNVRLDAIDEDTLGEAMTLAWRNAVDKGPPRARRPARAPQPSRSRTRDRRRTG